MKYEYNEFPFLSDVERFGWSLRKNILYIKWKCEIDITNTCIHECINSVHTISKPNELIMSHVDMLHELIDTQDGFSTIGSLDKNEITDFIISVSTIEFN